MLRSSNGAAMQKEDDEPKVRFSFSCWVRNAKDM